MYKYADIKINHQMSANNEVFVRKMLLSFDT